jgi:hypothetical protein
MPTSLPRVEGGVRIDPCVPTSWRHAEARIRGPAGVVDVEVDGKPVGDAVARLPEDGTESFGRARSAPSV